MAVLEEEMTEHLGHEKNRVPDGREFSNVRNGTLPKTVLTEAAGQNLAQNDEAVGDWFAVSGGFRVGSVKKSRLGFIQGDDNDAFGIQNESARPCTMTGLDPKKDYVNDGSPEPFHANF